MEIVENKNKLTILGRYIIPWAIKHRIEKALKYVKPKERILDIGCGNGYLLKHAKCQERIGIYEYRSLHMTVKNKKLKIKETKGVTLVKKVNLPSDHFDYITMIATIEHLKHPKEILHECSRMLKKDGLLIMTTPKKVVESILFFLDRGSEQLSGQEVEHVHETYFNLKLMNKYTGKDLKLMKYKRFQLGVNQLFVYKKK